MLSAPQVATAPSPAKAEPFERVVSVDALRGLVIALMIFVNDIAGAPAAPSWLKHVSAKADAMTLPDIVFPAFLFIAGVSIPLAFHRASAAGLSSRQILTKVLGRTLSLLVMGVIMVNIEAHNPWQRGAWGVLAYVGMLCAFAVVPLEPGPRRRRWLVVRWIGALLLAVLALTYKNQSGQHLIFGPWFGDTDPTWLRHSWWGILGLIGWAYFVSSVLYLIFRRRREWLVAAVGMLMLLHVATLTGYPERLASREWLAWAEPVIARLQLAFVWLNSHVSVGEALGSLAAITMAGCCLGTILLPGADTKTHRDRLRWAAVFTSGLALAALLLDPLFGLNKIRATPSWCFVCAAVASASWMLLYWLMDMRGHRRWTEWLRPAGEHPLLAYLIHPFLYLLAGVAALHFDFYKRPDLPLLANIGGSVAMVLVVLLLTKVIVRKTGYRLKV